VTRAASAPQTVAELIRYGSDRFKAARLAFGHGLPTAEDEAAFLTLHALGLPPERLPACLDARPTPRVRRKALTLFERRIRERKPAPYLTGIAWLGGLRFHVDRREIVPRSYIGELLSQRLRPWLRAPRKVRSALDLCTGSGCLAIMLARAFSQAQLDAADSSSAALRVARRNVAAHRLTRRERLVRSDLFAALRERRYDVIVSNPPYVSDAAMRRLPPEYRHEPALALAGGRDGLDLVRNILQRAPAHLAPGGMLVMEVGHRRDRVERAFPHTPFIWPVTSGGDDCVFVISRNDLEESLFAAVPARREAR
jgi:ribosomal protein L3 glutamine methyltransferase